MFATHELGHALGHLEDEYTNANILRENANSTQNSQPATARWKNFIGINGIGLALRNSRWYYPSVNEGSCIMANGRNFCLVCSAAMVERLADSAAMPFYGTLFNGVAVTTDQKQLNTATAITVPDGTDWIVDFAFHGCDRLQTLTIPASVKTIGEYAFLRCTGLTDITNQAVSPQNITAGADRFYGVTRSNITLNVPAGTTSAYLAAGWTGFREIREGGRTNNAQAPAITAQPTDVTVDVGASVQLTVTATVTRGELGYQWFESAIRVNHSGSPIASATNASYQPSTSEVGAKYYYCIITNTDSQATGTKTAAVTSDVAAVTVNQKGGDDTGDPGDDTGDPGDDTDDPGDDTGDSGDDTGDSGDDTGDPGDDTWEDGQIYVGGEIVLYQGQKWRAKWWTLSAPGTDDSWELMSDSNEYIPGRAYVGGETVVYQGQTWRAKWWTTAVPGSDNTWELVT
jgi:hypothetical protein